MDSRGEPSSRSLLSARVDVAVAVSQEAAKSWFLLWFKVCLVLGIECGVSGSGKFMQAPNEIDRTEVESLC